MTLVDIGKRVLHYGVSGVILWLRIKLGERKTRRFIVANARKYPLKPERGLTIVAGVSSPGSISKVMRDLALTTRDAGFPVQIYDPGATEDAAQTGILELITPLKDFRIRKYSLVLDVFDGVVPPLDGIDVASVAFWEFEDGFLEVYSRFSRKAHVVAMSDFNAEVFRRLLPVEVRVSKLLYPFRFQPPCLPSRGEIRKKFGIPSDAFAVFFNFDFGSGYGRKNPDGAMRAFAKAFADDETTVLVFKTIRSSDFPGRVDELKKLADGLGIARRFIMVSSYLSNSDLYGLTNACDAYLSLHRGEGFGLGVAEAMSMGVPVVVTDYSSTMEFCMSDNSIPVPCKVVPIGDAQTGHLTYSHVTKWAEPDVDFAADALRRLKSNPEWMARIGAAGKSFMAQHFSIENFKASLSQLLNESVPAGRQSNFNRSNT